MSAKRRNGSTVNLYLQQPKQLEEATRPNLEKKLSEFVESGGGVLITASSLPLSLDLVIKFV